jgi:hypothetical protein
MLSPKPPTQLRKLGEQAIGTFALYVLDQPTDSDVRWDGDHDMDMIGGDRPLEDIDVRLLTSCRTVEALIQQATTCKSDNRNCSSLKRVAFIFFI